MWPRYKRWCINKCKGKCQGLRELERRVLTAETQRFQFYEELVAQLEHLSRERPSWNEWEERLEAVEGALPSSSPGFLASPPPVLESRIPHVPVTVPIYIKGLFLLARFR